MDVRSTAIGGHRFGCIWEFHGRNNLARAVDDAVPPIATTDYPIFLGDRCMNYMVDRAQRTERPAPAPRKVGATRQDKKGVTLNHLH
jgi:hypothetical protein